MCHRSHADKSSIEIILGLTLLHLEIETISEEAFIRLERTTEKIGKGQTKNIDMHSIRGDSVGSHAKKLNFVRKFGTKMSNKSQQTNESDV